MSHSVYLIHINKITIMFNEQINDEKKQLKNSAANLFKTFIE